MKTCTHASSIGSLCVLYYGASDGKCKPVKIPGWARLRRPPRALTSKDVEGGLELRAGVGVAYVAEAAAVERAGLVKPS